MAPDSASRQYVSNADSHSLLSSLEQLPGEPGDGFFGPGSITWRVNRESVVFLGAGRAALLQLAHPWVAASLAHHSNLTSVQLQRALFDHHLPYQLLSAANRQPDILVGLFDLPAQTGLAVIISLSVQLLS